MRKKHIVVLLALLILLAGCGRNKKYPFAYTADQISSIEIVSIPASSFMYGGNLQDIVSVKTLPAGQWEIFLSDFHAVPCYEFFNDPPTFLEGMGFRVTYLDGTYEIVDSHTGCYIANRELTYRWYGFDRDAFAAFIEKHRS